MRIADNELVIDSGTDTDIRVLSVEDSARDANLIVAILDERRTGLPHLHFDITNADSLKAARGELQAGAFDVIVLDLNLPDSQGLATLSEMLPVANNTPIIVFTGNRDLEHAAQAVRIGAQDYLVKGQTNGPLLARAIRYALERRFLQQAMEQLRQREQADRELQAMLDLVDSNTPAISTRLYGELPLKDEVPELHDSLVDEYCRMVETALDIRFYKEGHDLSGPLRALARQIGNTSAGPRDVIAIHTEAVKKISEAGVSRSHVVLEESRYILLELMGYLTSYYRMYARGVMRISNARVADGEER